jgi:hypothetical protein
MSSASACRGCGASLLLVPTAATGKLIPLNPQPEKRVVIGEDGKARVVDTWLVHFATCPVADQIRTKRKSG